ncbi:hypothetical protein H9Q74_000580 [Fusarium xylarioides]|nr:hypothetical protein H9Q71_004610 [Fusarium xylarioides]KAG5829372.1 hypothetical protein H9Q74_000580 [Fusarium xylarioides]
MHVLPGHFRPSIRIVLVAAVPAHTVALVLAVHSFSLHTIVLTSAIRVVRPPNFPRFISTTFEPVAAVLSDATLFEITNNIAIHLLESNN